MSQVFLGVGSNHQAGQNLQSALDALTERYGELVLSSVYESEAINSPGPNYLNLVVGLQTGESVETLFSWLRGLEHSHGRRREGPDRNRLPLDVDILTYDDRVGVFAGVRLPREEILTNAFVLQPLAEIASAAIHPSAGRTYGQLWADYRSKQKLWPVPFTWRGKDIPCAGLSRR